MSVIRGLSLEDYKKLDGVNKSTLDLVNKAPALIEWMQNCPEDTTKENAGIFGNAFHTLVLEPEMFESRYIVAPNVDRRTTSGKKEYAEFIEMSKGLIVLSQDDMHKLKLMQGSVMAHPESSRLIELSEKEVTFHCDRNGYFTKSRHDLTIIKSRVSCDLKTIDPGNKSFEDAWGEAVEKRRYDVQAAHYGEDFKHEFKEDLREFYFIVVSKSLSLGRYECRVMKLNDEHKDQGKIDRDKDLKRYLDCLKSGKFPGIETTVSPAYAKRG